MKKFLFAMIACFGVVGGAVGATYNCKAQKLDFYNDHESNEYLYLSKADDEAELAYVCGHRGVDGCDDGAVIFVTGTHFWDDQSYFETTVYECNTSGGNTWRQIGTTGFVKCGAFEGKEIVARNNKVLIYANKSKRVNRSGTDAWIGVRSDFCYSEEVEQEKKDDDSRGGEEPALKCPNGSVELGLYGGEADFKKQCSAKGKQYEFKCHQKNQKGGCACGACEKKQEQKKSCRELRAGNLEGMACCDLPEGAAKWEGGKCICSGGLKFEIKEGKGVCVQEVKPGEKFECNAVILNALNTWLKDCVENTQIVTLITVIQALCKSEDRTVEDFNTLYQTLLALNPGDCKKEEVTQTNITIDVDVQNENRLARENIIAAHGQLEKIASGFGEASKWKTAEGNFNTARLMTDLSAGVVLGTVGGVVTSVLVKKKQVEEGFEDLKCTIGGQVVGNWGDEFRVGLQQ